jgi:hypothetical protein
MRIILIATLILLFLPVIANAQEYPKAEAYAGYGLLREIGTDGVTLHGFLGSVEGNINEVIGIVGEFGAGFKTISALGIDVKMKQYTFMAGPRFNLRADKVRVFTQFLVGGAHLGGGASVSGLNAGASVTGFSWGVGGGLDFPAGKSISIRPVQVDILASHFSILGSSGWEKDFRYSAGVVFKFGVKK